MALSFSRPTTQQVPVNAKYDQQGKFSYGGSGPASAYSGGVIQPGDPIFLKLVDNVNFQFAYHVVGADHVEGNASLALVISQTNGWQKTIELSPDHAFSGDTVLVSAKVDLNTIRQVVADVEASTGVHYDAYTVLLSPQIKMTANVAGAAVSNSFAPTLSLRWDATQLQVNGAGSGKDVLTVSNAATTTHSGTQTASLSLLFFSVSISALRVLSILGAAVALIALAIVSVQVRNSRTLDEAQRILRQYGSLLLDATAAPLQPGVPQFSVKRFRDLVDLAEPDSLRIFHEYAEDAGDHRYTVMRPEAAYRYTCVVVKPAAPSWRAALPIAPQAALQDAPVEHGASRLHRKSIAGVVVLAFVAAALSLRAGAASAGDISVASTPVSQTAPTTSVAAPAPSILTQTGAHSPVVDPTSAVR
ncbi:MAG TPA: DUF5305 family protein [Tepidiformaceae bacterium]